jgi:hypothetical protein
MGLGNRRLTGKLLDSVKGLPSLGPVQMGWDKEVAERLQAAKLVLPPVWERTDWDKLKHPERCSQSPM